jgi:CRISPR-associated exonuclease Cas4
VETPDLIPISALQHWSYCPRQCGLIHLEQSFSENLYTLRGQAVHARVDDPGYTVREGVRAERALPVWNERLELIGKCDIVEFLADGTPYPVEYKHGKKRGKPHDALQLAAQALCLEEMTGHAVSKGAIYQATSHARREVPITPELRQAVTDTAQSIRAMLASGTLPPPANDERCRHCSLIELCQPAALVARDKQHHLVAALFTPEDMNVTP